MSISGFEILSKIGQGAYSIVFKIRRISDGKIYALKKVSIDRLADKEKKNALNEIRIMASIKNPNVISYKEAFFEENDKSLCLVMEFADSGDLFQRIQKCKKRSKRLNEDYIWSVIFQLTNGLKALHDLGILHRDIKSANVFLNKNGSVKLGDMNVSKVAKDGFLKTQTGTPFYASPEVWKEQPYTNKSDIWSLGCVIYEATCLRLPFKANDMQNLFDKILEGHYEPISKRFSKELSDLVTRMISLDPSSRPSCDEILSLDAVKSRNVDKHLIKTDSILLGPIKVPDEISRVTLTLPKPDYQELESPSSKTTRLPVLGYISPKARLDVHKSIETSSDRLQRIKEIYLSPKCLYLSPQYKKGKYVGVRQSNN